MISRRTLIQEWITNPVYLVQLNQVLAVTLGNNQAVAPAGNLKGYLGNNRM
jgi:hypothetical protein